MSRGRVALLTGSLARPKPYDMTQRKFGLGATARQAEKKENISGAEQVAARLFEDNSELPATSSILKGMTPKPNRQAGGDGSPAKRSPTINIDWQIVSREAEIVKLKAEVQRLESLIKSHADDESKLTIEHTRELTELRNKLQREENRIVDLQRNIKQLEASEQSLRYEIETMQGEHRQESEYLEKKSLDFELKNSSLMSKVSDLECGLESVKAKHASQIEELEFRIQAINNDLAKESKEKQFYRNRVEDLHNQVAHLDSLQNKLNNAEKLIVELQKDLSEREDGKKLSEVLHHELLELKSLKSENIDLKKSLAILEAADEERKAAFVDLQNQLSTTVERLREVEGYQIRCAELENEIRKRQVNEEANSANAAKNLASIKQNEQKLVAENANLVAEVQKLQASKAPPNPNEAISKELTNVRQKVNDQIAQMKRLQRRLLLITKERDNYKKVLDSYEHEVTMADTAAPQRERISSLESTVNEYRTLVEQLEGELKKAKEGTLDPLAKDEIETLKKQILELQQSKVSVEDVEMEGDDFRVIHLAGNPVDEELQKRNEHYKQVLEDNKRLSARVQLLESGKDDDITRQIDEGIKSTFDAEKLKEQLATAERRQKKLMEAFKSTSKEFREVVYIRKLQRNLYAKLSLTSFSIP